MLSRSILGLRLVPLPSRDSLREARHLTRVQLIDQEEHSAIKSHLRAAHTIYLRAIIIRQLSVAATLLTVYWTSSWIFESYLGASIWLAVSLPSAWLLLAALQRNRPWLTLRSSSLVLGGVIIAAGLLIRGEGLGMLAGLWVAAFLIGWSAWYPLSNMIFRVLMYRTKSRKSSGMVIECALFILHQLRQPHLLRSVVARRNTIWNLEQLANYVERAFPYLSSSGAGTTFREAVSTRSRTVAAAIREWKVWVLSPQRETRESLEAALQAFIIHYLRGEWHYLPQREPVHLTPKAIGRRIYSGAIGLFRAAVPLGLVLLWKGTGIGYNPDLYSRLIAIATLVGLLQLLLLVDPAAKEKIGTVMSVTKNFNGGGKEEAK